MKIKKRAAVKASEMIAVDPITTCPYEKAVNCIMNAIVELGEVAKEDCLARESIANLSVVLFDLKGE